MTTAAFHITASFSHPFEGIGMELVKPKIFAVRANGGAQDLLGTLKQAKVMDHTAWTTDYKIKRPGVLRVLHGARTLLGTRRRLLYHSLHQNRSDPLSGMMKDGTGRSG